MNAPRDLWFGTSGPRDAKIMLVGESWGEDEAVKRVPFVGRAGYELDLMLNEAGLDRNKIFMTNVVAERPTDNEMEYLFHTNAEAKEKKFADYRGLFPTSFVLEEVRRLYRLIDEVQPDIVIGAGNYALWALTTKASTDTKAHYARDGRRSVKVPTGIMSWRGSQLYCEGPQHTCPFLPIVHPSTIFHMWTVRAPTVHDLRMRVPLAANTGHCRWAAPPRDIVILPTAQQLEDQIERLLFQGGTIDLAVDVETKGNLITCVGFAWSKSEAMVVSLFKLENKQFSSWYSIPDEMRVFRAIVRLLSSPQVRIIGQNFIYDQQHFLETFGFIPDWDFDTMVAQHLCWPGTPKGLDYLSSIYCYHHVYWKDDNKEWDLKGNFEQHLYYNGEDCIRTYEIKGELAQLIERFGFQQQWTERKAQAKLALRMMNRGVLVDECRRGMMAFELAGKAQTIKAWLLSIIPQRDVDRIEERDPKKKTKRSEWVTSPAQQKSLFAAMGMKVPTNRKTGEPSLNEEGLIELKGKHPEFTRIFDALLDLRSINVFHKTFISAEKDRDGRWRSSFNIAGTETFRWSSSKNAFGRGLNLQNVPKGDEK